MKKDPVYKIEDFESGTSPFYANDLSVHVRNHTFTNLPHRHDFFLVMLITHGSGWHEIDFKRYKVRRGSVFLMQPGQVHYWKLSKDIKGFVFFHSKSFFDEAYMLNSIGDFPFFSSFMSKPQLFLSGVEFVEMEKLQREILEEFKSSKLHKLRKLHSLVNIVYINISRVYTDLSIRKSRRYQERFREFQQLLEAKFKLREFKLPKSYAAELGLSEKHLNRIVQENTNDTTTNFIAKRLILEAKRLLMRSDLNVNEISDELGFSDASYFIRFFKKCVNQTPLEFLKGVDKGSFI